MTYSDPLKQIFKNVFNKLIEEINLYKVENSLSIIEYSLSKSGITICLNVISEVNNFLWLEFGIEKKKTHKKYELISKYKLIKMLEESLDEFNKALNNRTKKHIKNNSVISSTSDKSIGQKLVFLSIDINTSTILLKYHRNYVENNIDLHEIFT